jgi:MFS family permease
LPFFLENLDVIFASRLLLGVCEAGILTIVNTLIADYWEDGERRTWLMLQGLVGPLFQSLVFLLVAAVAAWRWNGSFLVYLVALPIFVAMYLCIFEPRHPDQQAAKVGPGGHRRVGRALSDGDRRARWRPHAVLLDALLRVHRERQHRLGRSGRDQSDGSEQGHVRAQLLHPGRLDPVPHRFAL